MKDFALRLASPCSLKSLIQFKQPLELNANVSILSLFPTVGVTDSLQSLNEVTAVLQNHQII